MKWPEIKYSCARLLGILSFGVVSDLIFGLARSILVLQFRCNFFAILHAISLQWKWLVKDNYFWTNQISVHGSFWSKVRSTWFSARGGRRPEEGGRWKRRELAKEPPKQTWAQMISRYFHTHPSRQTPWIWDGNRGGDRNKLEHISTNWCFLGPNSWHLFPVVFYQRISVRRNPSW